MEQTPILLNGVTQGKAQSESYYSIQQGVTYSKVTALSEQ
jgi:hypothetical protein